MQRDGVNGFSIGAESHGFLNAIDAEENDKAVDVIWIFHRFESELVGSRLWSREYPRVEGPTYIQLHQVKRDDCPAHICFGIETAVVSVEVDSSVLRFDVHVAYSRLLD